MGAGAAGGAACLASCTPSFGYSRALVSRRCEVFSALERSFRLGLVVYRLALLDSDSREKRHSTSLKAAPPPCLLRSTSSRSSFAVGAASSCDVCSKSSMTPVRSLAGGQGQWATIASMVRAVECSDVCRASNGDDRCEANAGADRRPAVAPLSSPPCAAICVQAIYTRVLPERRDVCRRPAWAARGAVSQRHLYVQLSSLGRR